MICALPIELPPRILLSGAPALQSAPLVMF